MGRFKYQDSVYTNMGSVPNTKEDLFLNPDSLQIMYCLAEKNPKINLEFIAKETKLSMDTIEPLVSKMTSFHLVDFEDDDKKGYTLTRSGLASLYTFHRSYVVDV